MKVKTRLAGVMLLLSFGLACAGSQRAGRRGGPAILDRVPADTPYILAALEPWPRDYLEQYLAENRQSVQNALNELRLLPNMPEAGRFLVALLEEIEPHFTLEGLTKLGMPTSAPFVFYGLGLLPVIRTELADPVAFSALLERALTKSGLTVDRKESGARRLWTFTLSPRDGRPTIVVAIEGRDLILTFAPAAHMPQVLARALGDERIGKNLGLDQLAGTSGSPLHFIGFIDVARSLARVVADRDILNAFGADIPPLAPPCADELAALAVTSPRWVVTVDAIAAGRAAGTLTIELRPELARALVAARASVPGVGASLGGGVVSIGAGLDVAAVVAALREEAQRVAQVSRRCGELAAVGGAAADLARTLGEPLPPVWSSLRGFSATLHSAASVLGIPQVKAYGLIAASDPLHLIDLAKRSLPSLQGVSLPADGRPVKLPSGTIPFMPEIHLAMRGGILGVAMGGGMNASLAALMAAPPHPRRPLLAAAWDEKKLAEVLRTLAGDDAAKRMTGEGEALFTVEATERGLVIRGERTWKKKGSGAQ